MMFLIIVLTLFSFNIETARTSIYPSRILPLPLHLASNIFLSKSGYKEKLSAFQARREKEGAGVNKRDVRKYMRQQQKEAKEPVNNAFAQALAGLKLD